MTNQGRVVSGTDFGGQLHTCDAVVAKHTDLDQLVTTQGEVDFARYFGAQARVADHDDRHKMVSARLELAALLQSRRGHSGSVNFCCCFRHYARGAPRASRVCEYSGSGGASVPARNGKSMERKNKGHVKPTRSVSSNRWMHEHVTDPYVQQAKKLGYRSRSAFKILEIDEKMHIFRRGMTVVDLGAAPGGWSQMAAPRVGAGAAGGGRVIAVDLIEMQGMAGVELIQADFTTDAGLGTVVGALGAGVKVDLVLSDMAPNMSGIGISDQARTIGLCDLALEFAGRFLRPNGAIVVKTFQGTGFTEFLGEMRAVFHEVKSFKPKSSRDRSSELYLVAHRLRGESAGPV